ncbi:MAG: hypothetical protein U0232_21395 [Thermomicrobiales bacterium]
MGMWSGRRSSWAIRIAPDHSGRRKFQPRISCWYHAPSRTRPTLCSDQQRSWSASSLVTTMPPSPAVTFLLAWKLKVPSAPMAPTGRPRQAAPQAWQASSTTGMPC